MKTRRFFLFLIISLLMMGSGSAVIESAAQPVRTPTLIKDINAGKGNSNPREFYAVGNRVCFRTGIDYTAMELWCSDGTAQGTQRIAQNYEFGHTTSFNWQLYFRKDGQYWRTNGNPTGTSQLTFPNADILSANLTTVKGNTLYAFTVVQIPHYPQYPQSIEAQSDPGWSNYRVRFWRSDGTANGTTLVKDMGNPPFPYSPVYLTTANQLVMFYAYTPDKGMELWRSDGSSGGTYPLKDINPGSNGSKPTWQDIELVTTGQQLFFTPDLGTNDRSQLWRSDGSWTGTYKINLSAQWIGGLVTVGNVVYFHAFQPNTGHELWRSDGTARGTYLVTDEIAPQWSSSFPIPIAGVNGRLFFTAQDDKGNRTLWITDGTAAGTKKVTELGLPTLSSQNGYDGVNNGVMFQGKFYFTTSSANSLPNLGYRYGYLWQSDGTAQGTQQLRYADGTFVVADGLTAVGNTLYFSGYDPTNGAELWKIAP